MCPQVDGHNLIGQSPQEKHLLRAVLNLWSGSLVLQSKVHGTKSNIWCTFITLRDKKTLLRSQMSGRKTCTLCSALQPGSSEKAQSAPCEETRACLNRAGIIPGMLLAVVAAILLKTLASSWMSTGAWRGCEAGGVCNNSSCLLAIHKKWSELQNVLREHNHLSFYSGNTSTVTST